ncbi:MAG: hypothetical protein C9356_01335 [Oleiphilus sp.]|nr:MAG: hypothetical protein C9356_01335 [Oleiphilus sp.]
MSSKVETLTRHRDSATGANIAKLGVLGQLQGFRLLARVGQWRHNRNTRKQLSQMPEYLLEDIGLEREQLRRELRKRFWQE